MSMDHLITLSSHFILFLFSFHFVPYLPPPHTSRWPRWLHSILQLFTEHLLGAVKERTHQIGEELLCVVVWFASHSYVHELHCILSLLKLAILFVVPSECSLEGVQSKEQGAPSPY